MALDQVKTIYSITNQTKKFFSSEKSGFSTGAEAVYHLVNDLLTTGAMTLANLKLTTSGGASIFTNWPVLERNYKLTFPGSGYFVNDKLILTDAGEGKPLLALVTSVNPVNGAITDFTVIATNDAGDNVYAEYTEVSTTQPNPLEYVSDDLTGPNYNYYKSQWVNKTLLTNTKGSATAVPPTPRLKYKDYNQGVRYPAPLPGNFGTMTTTAAKVLFEADILPEGNIGSYWISQYGILGSGYLADGSPSAAGSRWPSNGIIVLRNEDDLPTGNGSIISGQGVSLVDSTTGNILANTRIKTVTSTNVITGLKVATSGLVSNWTSIAPGASGSILNSVASWVADEATSPAYIITFDKNVSADVGAVFLGKGIGAYINNSTQTMPKKWTAVLKSTGAIDPMSDTVGVIANTASATTNSGTLNLTGLSVSGGLYTPTIYVGQSITNIDTNGSGVNGPVTVTNVTMTSTTTATITMSSNQTLSSNKTLKFSFDPVQTWRLAVDVLDYQTVNIYAGTELQLKDDCNITSYVNTSGTIVDKPGLMGVPMTSSSGLDVNANNSDEGFINRSKRTKASRLASGDQIGESPSYPLNSQLTITDRGIFFGVWEGNFSVLQKNALANNVEDNVFNWFLIQRPVDRLTGRILTTGRAPVFCINSVGYKYHKFIVRESDVFHPTQGPKLETGNGVVSNYRTPADQHSNDSFAILNTTNQIALTEDNKYLVSFLHNLTTPRFRYSEELDIIGQTSADVCVSGNDLSITAYQESGPRIYKALPSNKPYNTGLRLVVLKNIS